MSTDHSYQYLFGPVPSRRLGRSLGVDIIPFKTCTQNCIYCQLGKDAAQTVDRQEYVPIDAVLAELDQKIADGLAADCITISGSGEPTLNSGLGDLIDGIKQRTEIPVVVITNGTLLSRADVRNDCAKADIVLPSLDAGDAETFAKMNLPHADLDFETFISGLIEFRLQYQGHYWLEVFFCDGINSDPESVANIKAVIEKIGPDKVQINTSVRPVAHAEAARVSRERLDGIAAELGHSIEVIANFSKQVTSDQTRSDKAAILEMIRRRPCSLEDICNGLGICRSVATKLLGLLLEDSAAISETVDQTIYYKTP